ncbi:Asp-tRNA(Asn)/Glu-tRNA(Gln) amidotransferase subunit GatC [Candidatus Babeliales bacterium]|nr:Asp-tRNA(Asn)/Glu-tRNA(Gln) amidotransferase subunit GatC [Candidatus Babeliales bacterium]
MTTFNREELLKLAQLSSLHLEENEIDTYVERLSAILAYVKQLQEVSKTSEAEQVRNVNVFREDAVVVCDRAEEMLAQAPEREDHYFVVPKILD